jgi:outer membrane protein
LKRFSDSSKAGWIGACICLLAPAAKAETLADAIALAYQSNPTLQSARAQLRVIDENYVQARAGYRPTLQAQLQGLFQQAQQQSFFGGVIDQASNTGTGAIQLNQPLFTSGAVSWGVEAASDEIRAARQSVRNTEEQVLQGVIQAYVDVRRDERIVGAFESEVGILQSQLDDVTTRQKAGDVTRTDVEQSQTNLDTARASLSLAEGQLQVSRAEYSAVVGQNPGTLAAEPPLPGLPTTIDEAFTAAQSNNAALLQAEETERADSDRIYQAKAQYRPQVSLSSTYGYQGPLVPFAAKQELRSFSIGALVTIPILTGGVAQSNIRKATETDNADRLNIEAARRAAVQAVANAWNTALANRSGAATNEHAVETARRYFYDTEQEYRVGQRSTLDVLIAEQTLRAAEVAAAQTEHDCYLAQAALLTAVGRMQAADLVGNLPLYDPSAAFRKVELKGAVPWEGLVAGIDRLSAPERSPPKPLSAPTIAQGPALRSGPPIPADAPMATSVPGEPLPGTSSPATPPGLGVARAAPYTPGN